MFKYKYFPPQRTKSQTCMTQHGKTHSGEPVTAVCPRCRVVTARYVLPYANTQYDCANTVCRKNMLSHFRSHKMTYRGEFDLTLCFLCKRKCVR